MVGKEMGDEGKGEGTRERGQRCLSWRDEGLSLHREETDMAYRQMEVYKGKGGNPVLG